MCSLFIPMCYDHDDITFTLEWDNVIMYDVFVTLEQGLRASSLHFTSPLEFNAIFRDGFSPRLDLTAGSKIRDPVTAKFKHARLL